MGEQIWRGQLRGPLKTKSSSNSNQWAGRTTIASGDATQVVSTSAINSDSIVLYGLEANTRQNSGFGNQIEVSSIVSGSYFLFAWADGNNLPPRGTTIMWNIIKGS